MTGQPRLRPEIVAAARAAVAPSRTNAQRRRRARELLRVLRRGMAGWESSEYARSDQARVAYDSAAALKAMDARLKRAGMVRS